MAVTNPSWYPWSWRWREVWQANPGVANPNRIYPGDVLVVDYSGGTPRIRRGTGGGMRTVKLTPRVRVTDIDREVPSIPVNAVAPFLSRPQVLHWVRLATPPGSFYR